MHINIHLNGKRTIFTFNLINQINICLVTASFSLCTYRALAFSGGLRQVGIQLRAVAAGVGRQLLGAVVPHDERGWLQGAAHDAAEHHVAARLHVAVRFSQDLRAGNYRMRMGAEEENEGYISGSGEFGATKLCHFANLLN